MKEIEYFAYGSNMNLGQMAYRCPDAEVIGTVRLEGYRLSFAGGGDRGVATILPCPGSHVDGVLWEISKRDELQLDRYEGFPRLYGKETVTVEDQEGRKHDVMAYTMNAPYRDEQALPSMSYLYGIMTGCEQNGLDTGSVFEAFVKAMNETGMLQEQQNRQSACEKPRWKGTER